MTTQEEVTTQDQAKQAYVLQQEIVKALTEGREALWRASERLYAFEELRGWLQLGYETRREWLADPDVSMMETTYYRLVKTWQRLVVERKVQPERLRQLDQSKTAIVTRSIVEGTVTIKEALADAEALGWRDLREKYYAPKQIANVASAGEPLTPQPVANVGEPDAGPTQDDLDADAEDACWAEVELALDGNAEFPRVKRDVLVTLLAIHKAQLPT